jgi:hypothetical protein
MHAKASEEKSMSAANSCKHAFTIVQMAGAPLAISEDNNTLCWSCDVFVLGDCVFGPCRATGLQLDGVVS